MNYYKCSDGTKVSEGVIKSKLSAAYKEFYLFDPVGSCEGCGQPATCTAHIYPKALCKSSGKTEYIWNPINWFRSCFSCNLLAENVASNEIKNLLNYEQILKVTKMLDPQRYEKMIG